MTTYDFAKAIFAAVGGSMLIFVVLILSTLVGGIAGAVVGWVFNDTFVVLKGWMGLTCTNFELGAALGFVGTFFRSTTTK